MAAVRELIPVGNTIRERAVLTVKLDPKLLQQIKVLAADLGVRTSELVRQALRERVAGARAKRAPTVYERKRDLCGVARTADPQRSTRKMSDLIRARDGKKRPR